MSLEINSRYSCKCLFWTRVVADPILQRLAIEYGDETRVIVKSDRVRFAKAAGVSLLGRRLLGCRGKYHEREYRRLCRLE